MYLKANDLRQMAKEEKVGVAVQYLHLEFVHRTLRNDLKDDEVWKIFSKTFNRICQYNKENKYRCIRIIDMTVYDVLKIFGNDIETLPEIVFQKIE